MQVSIAGKSFSVTPGPTDKEPYHLVDPLGRVWKLYRRFKRDTFFCVAPSGEVQRWLLCEACGKLEIYQS